jgi:drug/metabolite transporter (DMT)-like permease
VLFALAAGLMWGLVFVLPLLLPDYPSALLSCGRYMAFGLIALPLGWFDRREILRLRRADWVEALKLAAVGNLLYYACLAAAIQRLGAPVPSMIIGALPVVISISANVRNHRRDGLLPWHQLLPSLLLIAAGIACVNRAESAASGSNTGAQQWSYATGVVLSLAALACWTWYPLRNADWLRAHSERSPRVWASAQGIATLPLALAGYLIVWLWLTLSGASFSMPWGPRPLVFAGSMVTIGLLASWLGTTCWNEASQRLPTALAGSLIVFETLAALCYAYLLRATTPPLPTIVGALLLLAGVCWSVRIKPVETG